jgi:hypothetical protein
MLRVNDRNAQLFVLLATAVVISEPMVCAAFAKRVEIVVKK